MTPNRTDQAYTISPFDVFGPTPNLSIQQAPHSPAFATVLNKTPAPTKGANYRQPAEQAAPERPVRASESNSSEPATAKAGKRDSEKAERTNQQQRKSDDDEQNDKQTQNQTDQAITSGPSPTSPPAQDQPDTPGEQASTDGDGAQAGAANSGKNLAANAAQPVADISQLPVDETVPPVETSSPQPADPPPANVEPQGTKNSASTATPSAATGETSLPTGKSVDPVNGNGPLSPAETGPDSGNTEEPSVASDGQLATEVIQPAEPSGGSGEKNKDPSEDSGAPQNGPDVQTPVLPSPDVLTNQGTPNAAVLPPPLPGEAPASPKDAPQPQTGASQSITGVQPSPTRLPQHVLTRSEIYQGHNPAPVPVDSARFLSRVAKAFAAAQQRDGEVRLRLSPPELGSLRLQVSVQDGVMVARMETETEAAKTSLTNHLPALRESLAEQGIRIERFDIDLMQQPSTGTPDRPDNPQQQSPEPQPFRLQRSNQAIAEVPTSAASSNPWSGQGRLNVII